jgi:hypothetical protein
MGSATSSRGTVRSNTIAIIRVGRQHTFSRAPVLLTFCACTELSAGESTTAPLSAVLSLPRVLDFKRCQLEGMKMLRPPLPSLAHLRDPFVVLRLLHSRTTCVHRRFELLASCVHAARPLRSWVHRASHVSGGHFLYLLLLVLSRSYSLYSCEHFLFYVFVISIFSVFTYIHCAHTRSRSALLVYLGERTGSLSGLISLSISDFSIGSVQSHHIYVFCTSSLALYLEGHIYLRTRRSSAQPDTLIPAASKIAQIDL